MGGERAHAQGTNLLGTQMLRILHQALVNALVLGFLVRKRYHHGPKPFLSQLLIIEHIDPLDVLFLINAVYFKADWTYQFDKRRTGPYPFRLTNGSTKDVPMMRQATTFAYYRGEDFSVVSLPYANGRFSMPLALPDESSSLPALYRRLTPANLERWIAGLEGAGSRIPVDLPRFTIEWERTLNETLRGLGMEDAFDASRADFAGIHRSRADLHLSEVKQKTFLKVDESGTEAAAVTSSRGGFLSGPPLALVFDRPFFLAIRDNATATLLFLGQVVDPQ
jgi:serine protease inhibitor